MKIPYNSGLLSLEVISRRFESFETVTSYQLIHMQSVQQNYTSVNEVLLQTGSYNAICFQPEGSCTLFYLSTSDEDNSWDSLIPRIE